MKKESMLDKILRQFTNMMIDKIKEVDNNWKKPWFSSQGSTGLPQNIDGRLYNGINSFMLYLLSEKQGYNTPVYMTFMQAKESGVNVRKGEKAFPVIYWNFYIKDKDGNKVTMDEYKKLIRRSNKPLESPLI